MNGLASEYLRVLEEELDRVVAEGWSALERAGDVVAKAIREGNTAYEHLGGHLMPYEAGLDRIGRPSIFTPLSADQAERLQPGDVLVMTHQYGVIEADVQMAIVAKQRGATVIAMAPRPPKTIVRWHPSGTAVADHADILIDTHIPFGDAALAAPEPVPGSCPTSGVVQAALYWALTCGVAERLARAQRQRRRDESS
jgi:uncharacterized phosphosugar-binding protein